MTYTATLWRAELRAVGALLVVVLLLALGAIVYDFLVRGAFPTSDAASRDLVRVISVGAVFTVLYGAPLYALAVWKRAAFWYVALAIGLGPSAALLPFLWREPQLALSIAGCGLMVAMLTHVSMRSNSTAETDARKSGARGSP